MISPFELALRDTERRQDAILYAIEAIAALMPTMPAQEQIEAFAAIRALRTIDRRSL